jgi:hypothetical protein
VQSLACARCTSASHEQLLPSESELSCACVVCVCAFQRTNRLGALAGCRHHRLQMCAPFLFIVFTVVAGVKTLAGALIS